MKNIRLAVAIISVFIAHIFAYAFDPTVISSSLKDLYFLGLSMDLTDQEITDAIEDIGFTMRKNNPEEDLDATFGGRFNGEEVNYLLGCKV